MLQRGAPWVEGVGQVIVQQAAQRRHVDIRKTTQAAREVSGVVARAEDAAKLGVEQVLCLLPSR